MSCECSNNEVAKVFKAFCDERRLRILEELNKGEKCACDLIDATGIAQSALSYHMKILIEAGVVKSSQSGKWTNYRVCNSGSQKAITLLKEITQQ